MPHSTVPYQNITYSSALNLVEADGLEQGRNINYIIPVSTLESEGSPSSALEISTNRSDDEDAEYSKLFEYPEWQISRKPEEHNQEDGFIEPPFGYTFSKTNSVVPSSKIVMDPAVPSKTQIFEEQRIQGKSSSPISYQTGVLAAENRLSMMRERSGEESEGTNNGDECNDESPMFEATSPESEQPMDIENNGIIWIPPEPEDEEDEKEISVFDDDDDYDGVGWALPCSTGSFSDSESKNKDRASEENRKAMRAVVDGHFRALVAQLLKGEGVPVGEENDKESWLEIVTSLSWQAASLVKPDTSKGGGGMDPGRPLLERIARCTGAQIVPSVDNLTAAKVGHCESFHVDKFVEEHGSAGQTGKNLLKTLMFFEGCPKPLGCTVLLKGSTSEQLKKVKRVVQFAVFAAYRLALETSFLADEGATLPELSLKSPITVTLPDKISHLDRSISTIPGFMIPTSVQTNNTDLQCSARGALTENTTVRQKDMLSVPEIISPLPHPGHLMSELSSSIKKTFEEAVPYVSSESHEAVSSCFEFEYQRSNNCVIDNGLVTYVPSGTPGYQFPMEETSHELLWRNQENIENPLKAMLIMDQKITGHENHDIGHLEGQGPSKEEFPPLPDQQSILVSLSTRCAWQGKICERALFRIKYYGNSDKPLGRFLRDDLFDQNYRCNSCDAPAEAHVHCYTHQQGSLTISVKSLDETVLPGEREGKIWMWHLCVKCACKTRNPHPTRRVVMSEAARGLSFGKFLELSFSNHAAASRAASCGHSLHRDCLRFYGFGRMVACFRYAPIHVYSVHLPPPKLEFNDPNQQEWLRKEASDVEEMAGLLFAELFDSLRQFGEKIASSGSFYAGNKVPESRRRIAEFEGILQKEKSCVEDMLQKSMAKDHKTGHRVADILELNRLRFRLSFQSREWKNRLQFLASSLKWSLGGSDSSIPEEFTLLVQKEKNKNDGDDKDNVCEKLIQGDKIEKDDWDASKVIIPAVEGNGCLLGGNIDDSSDMLQSRDDPITGMQGFTRPSSIGDGFQDSLLNDSLMGTENTNNGSGVLGKTTELPENYKPELVQHVETNINGPIKDSSTVEQALTYHALSEDSNRNGINGILREDKFMETDDARGRKDCFEGDLGFHTTLSEGNFLKVVDLSDTLDAAWTGKGPSIVAQAVKITSQGQEVGPAGPAIEIAHTDIEPAFKNEPSQVEKGAILPMVKTESMDHNANVQDKSEPERIRVSAPSSPVKSSDFSDEYGSWIGASFSDLYKTYIKSFQGSLSGFPPRLDSLGNYIPSFVSSVSQLGDQGGARLSLRPGVDNIIIAIYDDEPTSIIAYALTSGEYHVHIADKMADKNKQKEKEKETGDSFGSDAAHSHFLKVTEGSEVSETIPRERSYGSDDSSTAGSKGAGVADPFHYDKAMHVKVSFDDEGPGWKVKYMVTVYYAMQFDALRKKCCQTELDFIRSLCRCRKWGAQGGKSNVFFAKTLDDRFIIKQVTKTELESFIKFAPEYFKYLSDSLSTGSPTCLAKIIGIYQVTSKHVKGGKELKMDLIVMENLLYGRNVTRLYDLKGSVRSRYNADSTGSNKVLLDQNLLEAMPTSPIFVGNKPKRLLERAVWNDTSFLASIDVMDYSLLVGVDEERHELVLGIIDFMRQYTWDKHLETWVKASGILGGPKNTPPTVISPKQYKKRFRKAMSTYFLMVPDQWSPPTVTSRNSHSELCEDVASTFVHGN
ncbi:hypothetical protein KI387_010050 [Taxus chinensis]|uniref:1-phosphatidylinositol-3-phosphate 5-kinase n=1 Tax=Taxus chinensis TaxID=29808 RepID=A0AA38KIW0_TAXCH|nr:hypothetical protein KI387_010050 [Taxus chinensis]